jgi:hypothetical protein
MGEREFTTDANLHQPKTAMLWRGVLAQVECATIDA